MIKTNFGLRPKAATHLRGSRFLWSSTCNRVASIAVVYAIGLAIWSNPSDFEAGVHSGAATGVLSVHWRWLHAPSSSQTKKQKADMAKQKDETRPKGCWDRRRVAGRWKRAFVC